ncbi:MAG TPA: hypothetical protein VGF86_06165 [Candidatus Tumulicola sp.]|jgi:hypothetical protein
MLSSIVVVTTVPAARHLVYSFAYGNQQTVSARDAAELDVNNPSGQSIHATSGISTYKGALGDRGTIVVDVRREQPDGGLVVVISEQGEATRTALPAECVVDGNTATICDPNVTVNPEEYTLLRFLGANFVDVNRLDAHRHWSVSQQTGGVDVKADYTIQSENGGILSITESRALTQPGARNVTTGVQTKIRYDLARGIPLAIDEYVTQREERGSGATASTIYQTSLQLASDAPATP